MLIKIQEARIISQCCYSLVSIKSHQLKFCHDNIMHIIRFGPSSKIHLHHSRFGKYKYNGGHKKKSIAKVLFDLYTVGSRFKN